MTRPPASTITPFHSPIGALLSHLLLYVQFSPPVAFIQGDERLSVTAGDGHRVGGRGNIDSRRVVRLPLKALGIEPLHEAVWAIDPRAVAVRKGRPVVSLPPDQQAAGGLLHAVADFIVVLVFQALTDDILADKIAQSLEAQHKLAIRGENCTWREQRQKKSEYETI